MSSLRYEHSLSCFLYLLLLQLFVLQQLYYTETRHLLFSSTSPVWSHFRPFGSFILLSFMSELSEMNTLGQQSNLSINRKRKILSFQNIKTLTYKTLNMYCIEPPRPKSLPLDIYFKEEDYTVIRHEPNAGGCLPVQISRERKLGLYLADLGEARCCSINTFLLYSQEWGISSRN